MDCTICEEKFSEYLEKRLDSRQTAVLEGHVTSCLECSRKLDDWRYMMSVLDELEPVEVPEDAALTFDQAISWELSMNKPRKWFQVPAYQWAATSITAIAAVILLVASIPSLRQIRDEGQGIKKDTTLSVPELKEIQPETGVPMSPPRSQLPPVIVTGQDYTEISIREKLNFTESTKQAMPSNRSTGEGDLDINGSIKRVDQETIESIAHQISDEFPTARITEVESAKFKGTEALIFVYGLHKQKAIRVTNHKGLILYSVSATLK